MKHTRKLFGALLIVAMVSLVFWLPADFASTSQPSGRSASGSPPAAKSQQEAPQFEVTASDPVTPILTGPVRDLPPSTVVPTLDREVNPRVTYNSKIDPDFRVEGGPDPLLPLQEAAPPAAPNGFDTPIFNFNGQGYQFLNPPDTNGDVGADHYIQMINATEVAIYNKVTGALVQSFSLTSLGGCATGGGDPIVLYDQMADRWLLSEFGPGNSLCVFISQTGDPTGSYYSYQFTTPSFPDYPKYSVWPDAYYATANESSPSAIALNRAQMIAGQPATSQRFTASGLPALPLSWRPMPQRLSNPAGSPKLPGKTIW